MNTPRTLQPRSIKLTSTLAALLLTTVAPALAGECIPKWDGSIGQPGFNNEHAVRAVASYNGDLYAVGDFSQPSSPGNFIARWDGSQWHPVGAGFGNIGQQWCCNLYALAVFNGRLYAGGVFKSVDGKPANSIARWDGNQWEPLGTNGAGLIWESINVGGVEAMAVFDDGSGPALYIGGWFNNVDGVNAVSIVRWDGENFSPLGGPGGGVGGTSPFPRVRSLGVYDDGSGPALYAGGNFITAINEDGPITVNRIAKWDGQQWHALSNTGATIGANNLVLAFESFNNELYIGGAFSNIGGASASRIARFNGSTFSAVGSGVTAGSNTAILALQTYDDGAASGGGGGGGPSLYAAGFFTGMGGLPNVNHIARWNGSLWDRLGTGVTHADMFIDARINGLSTHFDGSQTNLVAAGLFNNAGQPPAAGGGAVVGNNVLYWGGCNHEVPPVFGDLNGDGVVDVFDLLILLSEWGECPTSGGSGSGPCAGLCGGPGPDGQTGCWCDEGCFIFNDCCEGVCNDCPALLGCDSQPPAECPADLNNDGVVDVFDLLLLLAHWG